MRSETAGRRERLAGLRHLTMDLGAANNDPLLLSSSFGPPRK